MASTQRSVDPAGITMACNDKGEEGQSVASKSDQCRDPANQNGR